MINSKAIEFNMDINQLIERKKKNIVSRFLKGYSHQEGVLKSFKAEIEGQFIYMPNLLFKRRNVKGSTTEELDQIFLIKMEEKKKIIEGFDYFYYYESNNDKEDNNDNIKINGKPLELEDDNLYFIEIKNYWKDWENIIKQLKKIRKQQIQLFQWIQIIQIWQIQL